jgi:hypothetical protein
MSCCVAAFANPYAARQYYSGWSKHPKNAYYYRIYYYKPTATYAGYKHHYLIYYPSKPDYCYYYSPYQKQYWGRCPVNAAGRPLYSMLAEKDRKGTLDEIPETAFPKPGPLPPIPESDPKENATLDLPPDDLPPGEGPPRVPSAP